MQISEQSLTYDVKIQQYDIHPEDYNKRLKAWKQLTIDIITEYEKILTEMEQSIKHNKIMKMSDHNIKVLTTVRTRDRIFRDFVILSRGKHGMYQEFRKVYVDFLDSMDKIENKFHEIINRPSINIHTQCKPTTYYSMTHNTTDMIDAVA